MKEHFSLSKDDLEDIRLRYDAAYQMNLRFIDRLIEVVQLTSPISDGLNILFGYNDTGKRLDRDIYNNTAQWASNARANKLHSDLLPIETQWGSIHSYNLDTKETIYEEDLTKEVFNEIDISNMHMEAKNLFLDVNIGCAAFWIDTPSDDDPLIFKSLAGMALMPEMSNDPTNSNVWFKKTVSWYDLRKINKKVAHEQDNKAMEFSITCGYLDLTAHHGGYLFLEYLADDMTTPIRTTWRKFKQLVLVNETIRAGEARGQGASMLILEKIRYINDLTESIKSYATYHAEPALAVDDNIPGRISELRGAKLPTALLQSGQMPVVPITWNIPFSEIAAVIQKEENEVRQFYSVMPLGMPEISPRATATEVGYRQADEQRQDVANSSRIASSLLGGIMEVVLGILIARGKVKLDKNKKIRYKFDSAALDIQAQTDLNSLITYAEVSQQVNGEGSFAMFNSPPAVDKFIREKTKAPESIAKTPAQLQQTAKQLQQQQQQQQQQGAQTGVAPQQPINAAQLGQQSEISGPGY